jgi:periodic tryptophan protein 2
VTIFTTYELFKSDFSGYEGFFSFFRKTFFGRRVDVNCNSRALADTRFRTKFLSKLPVGSVDTFQIFIWSLKTGRLLDILAGHQGPVTSLAFSPESTVLVSGSWDKTVRMWDVYEGRGQTDVLPHAHDVLCVAFRPDGKQIASATLDGQVFLWDPNDAKLEGTIEGRRDMAGGKVIGDLRSGSNIAAGRSFKTLAYSADGALLLAGGDAKVVCMYDVKGQALLKKFALTKSKAFDGVIERLDSNKVTDAGPLDLLPSGGSDSEDDEGLRRGDRGKRDGTNGGMPGAGGGGVFGVGASAGEKANKKRPKIWCKHVSFAPTGNGWCASTSEGVMVFNRDVGCQFDPTDLGEDVTPRAARLALKEGDARRALLMSLRLRGAETDDALVAEVLDSTPIDAVSGALREFPVSLVQALLEAITSRVQKGPHAQLMLRWTRELCVAHGRVIHAAAHGGMSVGSSLVGAEGDVFGGSSGAANLLPALRRLSKAFAALHDDLAATAETSVFLLDYVCAAPPVAEAAR